MEPRRGAWAFRNDSRDFAFWPRLSNLSITQEHPNMVASISMDVHDPDEAFEFQVRDRCSATFEGEHIWAGRLATVAKTHLSAVGTRLWVLSGKDWTSDTERVLIRRRRKRKKEKARKRLKFILRYLDRRFPLAGRDLSDVPDEYIEAYDYFGNTVAEALEHFNDEVNTHSYIDLDHIFRIYKDGTVAAPFDLDNDNPDDADSFTFGEFTTTDDEQDMANAILVQPEKRKHSKWFKDTASIAQYERLERFQSDENIHRPRQVRRVGQRVLANAKDPDDEMTLTVYEPGLMAGMRVSVTEGVWDLEALPKFIRQLDIRPVDPHDESGEAYLFSTATLTTKRKRRLRGRGGTNRNIDKIERMRRGQTVDTNPYLLDGFNRTVESPSLEEGDPITATPTWWKLSEGELVGSYSGAVYTDGAPFGPTLETSSPIRWVEGTAGLTNIPFTSSPCGIGPGAWGGWKEQEQWVDLALVPAHPTGLAGIYVDVQMDTNGGGYGGNGGIVYVSDAAPGALRAMTPVGLAPALTTTVIFIPVSAVPAAGERLWVGVGPNWYPDYSSFGAACATSFHAPVVTGENGSGRINLVNIANPRWAVTGDDVPDLGETATPRGAPWTDPWTWRLIGTEGAPVYGMDGNAWFVEDGGVGIGLLGEREDDDEPYGIWSDLAYAIEVEFILSALVDAGEAGTRSIELSATGEDEKHIGTLYLGDPDHSEGIAVAGPLSTDSDGFTFAAATRYLAVFDTRAGKVRGKVWVSGEPEPADWNVECAMDETEDDQDRVVLWLRAGAGQRIRVPRIRIMAGGHNGQRIVREFCGYASGVQKVFTTRHPYREGSLRVFVNHNGIAPYSEDGDGAEYRLAFAPTAGTPIRNTYIIDQGTGEDD